MAAFLIRFQPSSKIQRPYSKILKQMQMKAQPWLPIFTSTFLLYLIGTSFCSTNIKVVASDDFNIEEATIADFQHAFKLKKLTSRQLVDYYLHKIQTLNPLLRSVIEVNPDAKDQADEADRIREKQSGEYDGSPLLGIPALLKDSIDTADKMNTTGGSYALLGSKVARDAGVVEKLRKAGAVILGKASMSEWYGLRDFSIPDGWCARSGQGVNPYVEGGNPCGSSSGSAISVAANMAAVSLGTETDGSIICPADYNSVVGFKPTVGLTSRAGVIPISPRQDTIGPICRTVSDAVYLLDSIVGFDPEDYDATNKATKFIPVGGYKQFLNVNGLKGKRLGVVRDPFLTLSNFSSPEIRVLENHLHTLRRGGATVIDDLKISNIDDILDPVKSGELLALVAEFKAMLNQYLGGLTSSPVNSLADIIEFNRNNSDLERVGPGLEGQQMLVVSEMTNGIGKEEKQAMKLMENLSKEGFEKLMVDNDLDAMVTIGCQASTVLAIGGYPAITVPAGYQENGMPFGLSFAGLKGTEPRLIEAAYAFEQTTMIRRSPSLSKSAVFASQ